MWILDRYHSSSCMYFFPPHAPKTQADLCLIIVHCLPTPCPSVRPINSASGFAPLSPLRQQINDPLMFYPSMIRISTNAFGKAIRSKLGEDSTSSPWVSRWSWDSQQVSRRLSQCLPRRHMRPCLWIWGARREVCTEKKDRTMGLETNWMSPARSQQHFSFAKCVFFFWV